jgi:hypothetical protein
VATATVSRSGQFSCSRPGGQFENWVEVNHSKGKKAEAEARGKGFFG